MKFWNLDKLSKTQLKMVVHIAEAEVEDKRVEYIKTERKLSEWKNTLEKARKLLKNN